MGIFISPPPDVRQPIVIVNDGGGLVDDYAKAAWEYRLNQRRVEIRGSCRSACTYALTVPNVCVAPGAIVKWHHAYNVVTKAPRYDVTDQMTSGLPQKIRSRIEGRITVDYNPDATLTYRDLVALGVPDCDSGTRTAQPMQLQPKRIAAQDAPRRIGERAKLDIVTPIIKLVQLPFLPLAAAAKALQNAGGR